MDKVWPIFSRIKTFTYFDLSLEPADGDPGHSGVSVLRGPSAA